jgi:hypothetical protein
MRVSRLSSPEVLQIATETLGLDASGTDLFSMEGICASLRRAASFLCPTAPRHLVDAVLDALGPLDPGPSISRDGLMDQLGLLVSTGDLLELRPPSQRKTRQIFLGPPSYVAKSSTRFLLLGVRPYGAGLVGDGLSAQVHHEGHTRTIELDVETAVEHLQAAGLHEITSEQWVMCPRVQPPSEFLAEYRDRLSVAPRAGEIEGLTLIDPSRPVRYYRGRWREPKANDHGDFVARRPQAYGADLWCLVRIEAGVPLRLLDLPVADDATPGRDEAWRLQAAFDAQRGQPQVVRVRPTVGVDNSEIIELFSLLPSWAERYLELVGLPIPRANGSLISYRLPTSADPDLIDFLTDMLWMRVVEEGETN